jgi:2-polyprenyl-6-methoxyphenol hydroxylase-like FAD-dependent oxidoreductase
MDTPILIVGAGPTGLMLALWLTQFGVPFRIIDKDAGPGETSRAMGVQARTLELYQQIGLAQEVIAKGIIANEFNIRKNGKVAATLDLAQMGKGISPFPFLLSFPQDDHEKVLIEHLRQKGVEVERNTELLSFNQTSSTIEATLKTSKGTETVSTTYLCGCDGARSTVRTDLKLEFPGGTYSQIFFVADVMARGDAASGELQMCVSKTDFTMVLPIRSSGSLRLIGIVPAADYNKETLTFDDVAARVTQNTKLNIDQVNWFSTYHVHHRVAQSFQRGRIFILGDAAHIHSPVGGQGMNTGIGDAINLAWKLAAVLQQRATPNLLDTYEIERIGFANQLVATTDTMFKIMTNEGLLGTLWRGFVFPYLIPLLFHLQIFKRAFFKVISQTGIKYRTSPLSKGVVNNIHGGDRLPWVKFGDTDNFAAMTSLDWQVHVYGKANYDFKNDLQKMHIALNVFNWNADCQQGGLQEYTVYLVRPDGYVAYVNPRQNARELADYLAQFKIVSRS